MMKRKLYITLLGLLSTIMTVAVPYCDVRKFSITDGLAANTISDLKQGKDNLMWFSTWNGLSFYDGYKFHTFRDTPDDIDVLSTNRILKIEPSHNNNVWCITYDHQLYVYDTHFCRFFAVGQKFNELFNIDLRVSQVYPLKNGATWFTSEDGKYIIRSVGKTFDERNIELIKVGEKGLRSGNVWYIHRDIHGREWVLTDKGAYIYHSKIPSKLPFKWLRGVGEDEFLATEDGKLAKYDLQNRLTMIPMPEGVTRINQLKNTGYQLLLATNLGVIIYNPRTFKFDIINVQSPSQPLAEVKKIYTDDFGMVWAFTDGMGVTLINPKTGQKQWLFADQDDPMDRTTCESNFITQDENKTLWVVPRGGTFSYFDRKAGKLVPYLLRSNSSGNYRIPKLADRLSRPDTGSLQISPLHYQQAGCGRRRSVLGKCITRRTYLDRLSQWSNPGTQRLLPAYRIPFAKRTDCATAGKLRREGHLRHPLRYQGKNMDRNQRKRCISDRQNAGKTLYLRCKRPRFTAIRQGIRHRSRPHRTHLDRYLWWRYRPGK